MALSEREQVITKLDEKSSSFHNSIEDKMEFCPFSEAGQVKIYIFLGIRPMTLTEKSNVIIFHFETIRDA